MMKQLCVLLIILFIAPFYNAYDCVKCQQIINKKKELFANNPSQKEWIDKTEVIWHSNCNAFDIITNLTLLSRSTLFNESYKPFRLNLTDDVVGQVPDDSICQKILKYVNDISTIQNNMKKALITLFDFNQTQLFQTLDALKTELKPEIHHQVLELLNDVYEKVEDSWFVLDSEGDVLYNLLHEFFDLIGQMNDSVNAFKRETKHRTKMEFSDFNRQLENDIISTITGIFGKAYKHLKLMNKAVDELVDVQDGLTNNFNDLLLSNDLPI